MNVIRLTATNFAEQLRQLTGHSSLFDQTIEARTREIVDGVYMRGDAAVLEFTEKFTGAHLAIEDLAVGQAELVNAAVQADEGLRQAVDIASSNIELFARKSLRKNWTAKNRQGATVGEKFDPFQRVGIYIPGGTAPLVSTALMTVTLARVAGCKEIVVCTPCNAEGKINPALLFAARHAGATEIYRVGGAQAIAAMAYGTPTIKHVQKVFGPGNAYVVTAKRLLFGHVAIDLLPGPSEVMVIADDSANPKFIAADLLAQAEHGSGHERVWMVTTSIKLLHAVEREINNQLPKLSRHEFIGKALHNHGHLILVKSMDVAADVANALAPEHCEIMTKDAEKLSEKITTAGAIFLGGYSPTVMGDYMAGPSHTLPTGGGGLSFAGLTVDQFQRRTSLVKYNRTALQKSVSTIQKFAEMEGLDAHGRSATIRLEGNK